MMKSFHYSNFQCLVNFNLDYLLRISFLSYLVLYIDVIKCNIFVPDVLLNKTIERT